MAWKATGRAWVVGCCLPQASVHGIGSSKACCSAVSPISQRQRADALGGDAGDRLGPLGRAARHAVAQQLERRRHAGAVGQRVVAFERRVAAVGDTFAGRRPPRCRVALSQTSLLCGWRPSPGRAGRAGSKANRPSRSPSSSTTSCGALVKRLRKAWSIWSVRISSCSSAMNSAPSVPGLDRDPLVGNRRITGAHRVDRDEAAAIALELADRDLHRVAVVVFGGADHHEQLGAVQVGAAELPEAAADGVDHAGGHVDRAEAAVRRVVGRAELAREQAGQRLHLVAAGEQRELLRVGGADLGQALGQDLEGAAPRRSARTRRRRARCPALRSSGWVSRAGDTCFMMPDAALGADHALVQRVLGVAVDVAHLARHRAGAPGCRSGRRTCSRWWS